MKIVTKRQVSVIRKVFEFYSTCLRFYRDLYCERVSMSLNFSIVTNHLAMLINNEIFLKPMAYANITLLTSSMPS